MRVGFALRIAYFMTTSVCQLHAMAVEDHPEWKACMAAPLDCTE
eukprot:gene15099-6737_t